MPTLDETRAWVRELFAGVTDKAGEPFAEHCIRVEAGLPTDADVDERKAALLHDVLEDTSVSSGELRRRGYSRHTIWLVQALTRAPEEVYQEMVRRIASSRDPGLIQIKLSDNRDNSDPTRLAKLDPATRARLERKYAKARAVLETALATGGENAA